MTVTETYGHKNRLDCLTPSSLEVGQVILEALPGSRDNDEGQTTQLECAARCDAMYIVSGATEIAGVDNVARRSKGGQRGSGQGGTKKQGWTTQE